MRAVAIGMGELTPSGDIGDLLFGQPERQLMRLGGRRIRFLAICALATAGLPAMSGTAASQNNVNCAIYGAGYVAVQGTTRCARIRGRMRVNTPADGFRGANYLPYAGSTGVTLPAAMRRHSTGYTMQTRHGGSAR